MNELKVTDEVIDKVLLVEFKVEECGYSEAEAIAEVGLTEDEYRAGYRALNAVRIPEDELVKDFWGTEDVVDDDCDYEYNVVDDEFPFKNPLTYADYLAEQGYSDEAISDLVAHFFGWNE